MSQLGSGLNTKAKWSSGHEKELKVLCVVEHVEPPKINPFFLLTSFPPFK